ncbi:MAG: hypothetical protein VX743_11630, partial [Actinomycetota bacterium]|nr:hypothetical protein [Actinomycetota bacterium]
MSPQHGVVLGAEHVEQPAVSSQGTQSDAGWCDVNQPTVQRVGVKDFGGEGGDVGCDRDVAEGVDLSGRVKLVLAAWDQVAADVVGDALPPKLPLEDRLESLVLEWCLLRV